MEAPRLDTPRAAHIIPAETPRWRNWQTHYFEVVAPQGVQVQILSWASIFRSAQRAPPSTPTAAMSFREPPHETSRDPFSSAGVHWLLDKTSRPLVRFGRGL